MAWLETHYDLGKLIAPGATSLVFSALRKTEGLPVRWPVALKFVWAVDVAREEAERLVSLESSKGIVNLLDFFVVERSALTPLLERYEDGLRAYGAPVLQRLHAHDDGAVGVLVLQFLKGSPLVKHTVVYDEAPKQHPGKGFLLAKDVVHDRWMVQQLVCPLTPEQKFSLLEQIAAHVAECHEHQVVHADLHPHNMIYDVQKHRVTIMDLGGGATSGCAGWQAPEHLSGGAGAYAPETDIFLIGLLMHRLFESEPFPEVAQLSMRCLGESGDRPDASELSRLLAALRAQCLMPWHRRFGLPVLTGLLVTVLALGTYFYFHRAPVTLRERFGADDGATFVQEQLDVIAQEPQKRPAVRSTFFKLADDPAAWLALRRNLIRGSASASPSKYNLQIAPENLPPVKVFTFREGICWLLLSGQKYPVVSGTWFTDSLYFEGISYQAASGLFEAVFADLDGVVTRVPLSAPAQVIQPEPGTSVLYVVDADIMDLIWFANSGAHLPIVSTAQSRPGADGVLVYRDIFDLMTLLLIATGHDASKDRVMLQAFDNHDYYFGYLNPGEGGGPLAAYLDGIFEAWSLAWGGGRELLYGIVYDPPTRPELWYMHLNQKILARHALRVVVRGHRVFVERMDEPKER